MSHLSCNLLLALALAVPLIPSPSAAATLDPLAVSVTTDKASYNRGDQATLTLQVTNTALYPVTVIFNNGQQYDFTASDVSGATVWTWSHGQTFSTTPSSVTLNPGQTWSAQQSWSFVDDSGAAVPDGEYTLTGTFLGTYTGKSGNKTATQTVSLTTPDYLTVSFSADKSAYQRGDQAVLTLTMTNTAPYALTLSFPTAQQYDFSAADASGNTVWTWSAGQTFDPNPTQVTLAPGQSWTVQQVWTFVDNTGAAVPDGGYTVSGVLLGNYQGMSGSKGGSQAITLSTPDPLQVALSTDKSSYNRLQSATLTLTVTNTASYPVQITFPTSQQYDFSATEASTGSVVWTWSHNQTFTPTPQQVTLAPGQSVQYQQAWNFTDNNGLPAPNGTYTMTGTFVGQYTGRVPPKSGSTQIQVSAL